jgi:HK97 family phage portal protein
VKKNIKVFHNPFVPKDKHSYPPPNGYDYNNYSGPSDYAIPKPFWERWSTDKAIQEGMKASEWVFIAVSRIATAAASIPWKVYRNTGDGEREPYMSGRDMDVPHPIEQLLNSPNPYMNGNDFFEMLTQHLYLGGNALERATMLKGVPIALAPIMPDMVDVVPGTKVLIDHYDVWKKRETSTKPENVPVPEMLHIKFIDPNSYYWGMSPLQAVAKTVDTDVEAITWNKISLQNRAVSSGAFVIGQSVTPEQYASLRQMIQEQHSGSSNAYSPWLLSYGMDWKPMSLTPQELDFINSRKMNRESILAVYNVPPPMAGIYDNATYNNMQTARTSFYLDTIIPYMDNLRTALVFYFQQFKGFGTDWILDYDTSHVDALKPPIIDRVNASRTLFTMGVPMNALNSRFELELPTDLEYGDISFVAGVQTAENVVLGQVVIPPPIDSGTPTTTPPVPNPAANNSLVEMSFDPLTVSGRDEIWKRADNNRAKYEKVLHSIAARRLENDFKMVASHYGKTGEIPNLSEELWKKQMVPAAVTIVHDTGTRTMHDITAQAHSFSPQEAMKDEQGFLMSDEIMNYLNDWFDIRARQYNQTTLDTVAGIITQGKKDNLDNKEIANLIDDSGALQDYRAVNISRTETVGLQNYAVVESAKQSGQVSSKVWVSSRDVRVRDTHITADGQTTSLEGTFTVGGEHLLHPGDPSASAKEIVNCRCATTFVLKDAMSNHIKKNGNIKIKSMV